MIFCNIRTDFNFIFGQVSVARKLILNGGAIRPIGLLFSFITGPITIYTGSIPGPARPGTELSVII